MVTIFDLEAAREWLEVNNGEDGEGESCQRVADYLAREIERRIDRSAKQQAKRALAISIIPNRSA